MLYVITGFVRADVRYSLWHGAELLVTEPVSYFDSEAICAGKGFDLATLHDA